MCVLLHAFGVEHGVPKFLWIKDAYSSLWVAPVLHSLLEVAHPIPSRGNKEMGMCAHALML